MILATKHPWNHVILESDASNVINYIMLSNHRGDDESVFSSIMLKRSNFFSFQVLHCRRTANKVAHILASRGLHGSFMFDGCSHWFISKFVLPELVND